MILKERPSLSSLAPAQIILSPQTIALLCDEEEDDGGKKYEGSPLSGQQDDDYLAGKMIDLVCVLPLREFAVEQRHIFVRLVLQHLDGAFKS